MSGKIGANLGEDYMSMVEPKAKGIDKWLESINEDVSAISSFEVVALPEFLKLIKKLERKCGREVKKLKTSGRAKKLMASMTILLRRLKLIAFEIHDQKPKVYASFSLVITHLVHAASKLKSPQLHSASVYEFIKGMLDLNPVWIFTTVLATINPEPTLDINSLDYSLLALLLNDPAMVSAKEVVVQKAVCVASLLLSSGISRSQLKFQEKWNREEDLIDRCDYCDVPKIIQNCKKKLKIRIPGAEARAGNEFGKSSVGIGWSLSTVPAHLPEDLQMADSEIDETAYPTEYENDDCESVQDSEDNNASIFPHKRLKILGCDD